MSNVTPGYQFTSSSDPITYSKLNLLGTPTVSLGANEIVTANISDHAVTPIKLAQATGGGFLGRKASTLGDVSFVQLSDGSITWPTLGLVISSATTAVTEFTLGKATFQRFTLQYDTSITPKAVMVITGTGDTTVNGATGTMNINSGSWVWTIGDGSTGANSIQAFKIQMQGSGVTTAADIVVGPGALATTAINGQFYIPSTAGTPTGAADTYTGRSAIVIDSSANKIWVRIGGAWKYAALT